MKRGILLFVILALAIGMMIPSSVLADNNTNTPRFDNITPKIERTKISTAQKLLYDLFEILFPWDDDPVGTNIAPWMPKTNRTVDPGGDEDGWVIDK